MKITDEAVEAAARKRAEHYESEYDSRHLKWQDFIWEAREILDAALPHLDDDGAAAPPEAVHSAPLAGAGARDAVTPTAAPSSLPHLEGATPVASKAAVEHALNLHWWDEDGEPCACGFDFIAAGQSFKMHLADAFLAAGVFREGATPAIDREALDAVLLAHNIECTGPGEVTCRGCRDRGWMSWTAYRRHVGDAVVALIGGAQ